MSPLQRVVLVEARRALHNRRVHMDRERRLRKSYGSSWVEPPWCTKCDRTAQRVVRASILCQVTFS